MQTPLLSLILYVSHTILNMGKRPFIENEFYERSKVACEEERKRLRTTPRILTRLEAALRRASQSRLEKGDMIMNKIRESMKKIDCFKEDYYRTHHQRAIQMLILSGLLPFIYGPKFKDHQVEILEKHGFEKPHQEIFITMPRRCGKTDALAQFIAIVLLCIPRMKVLVFAPTKRQGGDDSGMMSHVKRILWDAFKFSSFFKTNGEVLIIKVSEGDKRQLTALPGGASNK